MFYNYIKNFKLFFLILLLSSLNLYALSSVEISQNKKISILEHSDVYLDDSNLTKDELTKGKYLQPYLKSTVNNAQSKSTVWIHFKLHNKSNSSIEKSLILTSPSLEFISLYRGDNPLPQKNGISINNKHSTIEYSYKIMLQAHESKEYFISVSSSHKSFLFQLILQEYEDFRHEDIVKQAPRVLMLGLLLGLMIYAFLLAFYSKDISYFYYGSYLFFNLWHQVTFLGLTQIYFPHWFVLFDMKLIILKLGFSLLTATLFAITFLKIEVKSYLYKFYIFFIFLSFLIIFFIKTLPIILIIGVIFVFFNLTAAIIVYRKGQKQARLFILGFGIVSIAYLMVILDAFGFTEFIKHFPNILMYAFTVEVLLLTLAFADRYKILQELKEKLDKDREQIIKNEVIEKTAQLNKALKTKNLLLKEVHHRVKNNLQIILSMIRLQSDKISELGIKEKFLNLENRINAIAKTYSMLIVDENLDAIDMDEYIEELLLDIDESMIHVDKEIELESNIEASLPIGKAVYIGIIINELVTNAYKYAFEKNKGKVSVTLYQKKKDYVLIIEDNGKGFTYNKEHKSLGLKLIQTLSLEQLKGKLEMQTQPTPKYTLIF